MANTSTDQRIAALELQNRELQARLDVLAPKQVVVPPATTVDEGAVRITFPRNSTPIVMPTVAEFERLLSIVARAQPRAVQKFEHESDRIEFFRGFTASFERITTLRRPVGDGGAPVLNTKFDAHWWADEAYRWLVARGTPAETFNGSFFAAVIAAGDIPYSFGNRAEGITAHVGLGYDGLTASTAGWHGVIERGQPRPPTVPSAPLRVLSRPAQVRITG